MQKQLEDSLAALQTDYIDIYQYHSWGDALFFKDDVQAVLEKAKAAGKVRHLGNSVGGCSDPLKQIEASSRKKIEVIQIIYNRLDRRPESGAFDLCVRRHRAEQMQGIDLSCLKLAYNGAEPVRADTIERFVSIFAPYGLAAKSIYPAYGMAEATVLISAGQRGAGPTLRTVSRDGLQQHRANECFAK